jgi:hypothetical protein
MDHLPASPNARVRQVNVPPDARCLSTLSPIGYQDAYLVNTGSDHELTAEEWTRAIMKGAPRTVQAKLSVGWSMIGLKVLRGASDRSVLGWQMRRCEPDYVLLGAESRIGMPGELLFKREHGGLLFATFVAHQTLLAGMVWLAVEPTHVRIVRRILEQASRRLDQPTQPLT